MSVTIDAPLEFSATAGSLPAEFSDAGFNEYGVRQNRDGDGNLTSIDVIFRAMEPGLRKNIRIESEFLGTVAGNFSRPIPFQFDHSSSQRDNVGQIRKAAAYDALYLIGTIPNTGSSVRSDTIADFTHSPPAITDGSVGFGHDYELEYDEEAEEYKFTNATLREFSLTPFPAGYDEGGLSPAFCEAAESAGLFATATVDDGVESPEKVVGGRSRAKFSHANIKEI